MSVWKIEFSDDFFQTLNTRQLQILDRLDESNCNLDESALLVQELDILDEINDNVRCNELSISPLRLPGNYLNCIRDEGGNIISPPYYCRLLKGWVAYCYANENTLSCVGLYLVPEIYKFSPGLLAALDDARKRFFKE